MPFRDGDVIEFDYELWAEGREGLYDTTLREAAEAAGILDPNAFYAPLTYVLGSQRLIAGLERALKAASLGVTQDVDLAATDAYGERDAKKIETLPIQEFKKHDVQPQVGLTIRYGNRSGLVTTVGGGRVRVDFNPALAGKKLRYRFTIRKVAQNEAEKLAGLIRMNFPANLEWKVESSRVDGKAVATVEVPEPASLHQAWPDAKFRSLVMAHRYTEFQQVRFVERYTLAARTETSETPLPAKTAP